MLGSLMVAQQFDWFVVLRHVRYDFEMRFFRSVREGQTHLKRKDVKQPTEAPTFVGTHHICQQHAQMFPPPVSLFWASPPRPRSATTHPPRPGPGPRPVISGRAVLVLLWATSDPPDALSCPRRLTASCDRNRLKYANLDILRYFFLFLPPAD